MADTTNTTTAAPAATQPEDHRLVTEADIQAAREHIADAHNGEQLRSAIGQLRRNVVIEMAARGLIPSFYGAAPAATQLEAERAAFDAWAMEHGYQSDELARSKLSLVGFEYFNVNVESAFQAWKAGRAAALAAPAAQEAEPVAYCQPDDPNPSEAFSWPGHCRQEHHTIPLYAHPPRLQVAEAVDAPEGCTPADARILRQANHDLAAESFELQKALRGIVAQAGGALARFDVAAAPQASAPLTEAELREVQRAADDIEDCGETDVDYDLLLRAAMAGYLECARFRVLDQSALDRAAARARQEGGSHG